MGGELPRAGNRTAAAEGESRGEDGLRPGASPRGWWNSRGVGVQILGTWAQAPQAPRPPSHRGPQALAQAPSLMETGTAEPEAGEHLVLTHHTQDLSSSLHRKQEAGD